MLASFECVSQSPHDALRTYLADTDSQPITEALLRRVLREGPERWCRTRKKGIPNTLELSIPFSRVRHCRSSTLCGSGTQDSDRRRNARRAHCHGSILVSGGSS